MKKFITVMILLVSVAAFGQKEDGDSGDGVKPDPSTSNLSVGGELSIRGGGNIYGTGFEGSEGFAPGFLGTQSGWSVFLVSAAQPVVTTANASSGTQSLRIDNDPGIGAGNLTGGFSPLVVPADPMAPTTASVNVFITATGGADYDFAPQAPSQGFLTARVNFRFTGPIRVLDGGVFVDTGVTWPVGQWFNMRVDVDPSVPSINYYLNDGLIYTANALVGGTTMEQVVLISDNFHFGDTGDFDELDFGPLNRFVVPTLGQWGLGIFIALLLGAGFIMVRRNRRLAA